LSTVNEVKMKKISTPRDLYLEVMRRAKKCNQSMRRYCMERNVNPDTVCKWKDKTSGDVFANIKDALLK